MKVEVLGVHINRKHEKLVEYTHTLLVNYYNIILKKTTCSKKVLLT